MIEESSYIPSKHRQGGQSAQRFQRLRDEACQYFYRKVDKMINNLFLDKLDEIKFFILAGPGHTKNEYFTSSKLTQNIKEKIKIITNCTYHGFSGVREVLQKENQAILNSKFVMENDLMRDFYADFNKGKQIFYGYNEILDNIQANNIIKIYISEKFQNTLEIENYISQKEIPIIKISANTEFGARFNLEFDIIAYPIF